VSPSIFNNKIPGDSKKNRAKILVVTGASGGHIFPALSFLDTLKGRHRDLDTLLILPRLPSTEKNLPIETVGVKVRYISISPIKLSIDFKNFVAILRFFKAIFESIFILLSFNPDFVVGFGSIACIPIIFLAWLFRITTLIHEQNVIPGRANRFLARFADRVAISFQESQGYFKDYKKKIVFTGNPLRKELAKIEKNKALDFFGFGNSKFTILVMGGSSGSHNVNLGLFKAISMMPDRHNLQVIHLSGPGDYDLLKQSYKDSNIKVRLFSFFRDMQFAYSASDLVVCRAGATTTAEIIFFRLPAIIIPYPFAYEHQLANARVLEKKGCAMIINDSELDKDTLKQTIEGLINNPEKIKDMQAKYDLLSSLDANNRLADSVLTLNQA